MNVREGVAYGLAAVGLVGMAVSGQRAGEARARADRLEREAAEKGGRLLELERTAGTAAKEAEASAAARARMEGELKQAQQAALTAQARIAEMEAVARAANGPGGPAASAAGRKKGRHPLAKMLETMMESPVMKEQFKQQMKAAVATMYGDLFQELGLSGEAREAAEALLADRMVEDMGLGMLLFDDAIPVEEILRRQEELFARRDAKLGEKLAADQIARLRAFETELPDRMAGRQADQQLQELALPQAQHAAVRAILVEERRRANDEAGFLMDGGGGSTTGTTRMTADQIRKARTAFSDPKALGGILKPLSEQRERIYQRVRPLMNDPQFESFKKQQEAEAKMMEMGLQMFQSMLDKEE